MTQKIHLLIDLDGTILGLDIDRFLPAYMEEISRYAVGRVTYPHFPQRFATAVQDMLLEHPGKTNEQAFRDAFFAQLRPEDLESSDQMFAGFYRDVFPELRRLTQDIPESRRMVAAAAERGYQLTLATSPVFPIGAIEERLRWAEVDPAAFRLITSVENCTFAKPDPRYYLEILERLGAKPEEALMIGNDLGDDGAAAMVGIAFAHVTGRFSRGTTDTRPDWQGSMGELAEAIERGTLTSAS